MEKIDVMLVVPEEKSVANVLKKVNLKSIHSVGAVTNVPKKISSAVGKKKITLYPLLRIEPVVRKFKERVWLLDESIDPHKMKNFLTASGVPEEKIINVEIFSRVSPTWAANVLHAEKFGADFFATGDEYMRDGLNLKFLPSVHEDKIFSRGGANLADAFQNLRQSYLTAKHVFEHVKRGTIKFVLIGLTPKTFFWDNAKDFTNCSKNLQYLSLTDSGEDEVLKNLFGEKFKENIATSEQADLNFDELKKSLNGTFSFKAIEEWDDQKIFSEEVVEENIQILKDYVELCRENEAQPVGVIFPFAPAARKNYDEKVLSSFRETIHQLEEKFGFVCVDMFNLNLGYNCFRDMTHLNAKGVKFANILLALNLYRKKIIPLESFCDMTYDFFHALSNVVPKDDYNALMEKVFEASAQRIRHKKKIKIGFVLYDASLWSGDDLYNYFAQDDRFEPTIFLCMRLDKVVDDVNEELFQKNLLHGAEQLKTHGLNVIALNSRDAVVPAQDVLIFLTPYLSWLPNVFQIQNLTAKTLLTNIPYAFDTATREVLCKEPIFFTAWKMFVPSIINREMYDKECTVGLPRGVYSGYPRMDVFFKEDAKFHFDWKMTRPDAKKIIYAPHWSIKGGVRYATFQWNYKFMYEFAKDHPEISWVVKPHPHLLYSAVKSGLFPTVEAFKEYFQKWDDLPNAKVYTGAYYQDIFATSDGMILDSGSFTVEYQYMDKPLIFLLRNPDRLNDLGKKVLEVSHVLGGKDLEGIAALIQKVFIEGNDDKAAVRRELFDKYLNYPKANGMLAGEFIYKNISDELKGCI